VLLRFTLLTLATTVLAFLVTLGFGTGGLRYVATPLLLLTIFYFTSTLVNFNFNDRVNDCLLLAWLALLSSLIVAASVPVSVHCYY
jgi:hypothetical protein